MRAPLRCFAVPAALFAAACGSATIGDPPSGSDDDVAPPPAPDASADAPPLDPDARGCSDGAAHAIDPATGTCYFYVETTTTWTTALAICVSVGATLATVRSDDVNALVAGLPTDPANHPDVWLGGTDVAQEGTFRWENGDPFDYDNFRDGEPNDGNSDQIAEDCLIIEADAGGTWDDRSCTKLFPFLCQRDPE